MMLDLVGLPKNINGFRTTHTCELCGFEPKTKNKYREKQDHLVMKHFKEKIDKIFPHCRPYSCPAEQCQFTGKDKQALLRHYTGKHGILEKYLREALAERGISYNPHEGGKRRNSDANGNGKSHKNPRMSLTPPANGNNNIQVQSQTQLPPMTTLSNEVNDNKINILTTRPNTEELRKEVEAMMRSFQPVPDQPIVLQLPSNSPPPTVVCSSSPPSTSPPSLVTTSSSTLPSFVLSAVANATAASIAAKNNGLSSTVSLPTQPADVPTITVQQQQSSPMVLAKGSNGLMGPSASSLPLPMEVITSNACQNNSNNIQLPTTIIVKANGVVTSAAGIVENEDVMWSSASSNNSGVVNQCVSNRVNGGPAVVVEAAPIAYIESVDAGTFAANTVSLDNIDYDYFYTPTVQVVGDVRERQLDFCML